jgi:hypothetical protein
VEIFFLTLGTLVHLRHFKLGCGYAALYNTIFLSRKLSYGKLYKQNKKEIHNQGVRP